jgi:hypothetical protein
VEELELNKETVQDLTELEADAVQGGLVAVVTAACPSIPLTRDQLAGSRTTLV